jgi:hypothetical protein
MVQMQDVQVHLYIRIFLKGLYFLSTHINGNQIYSHLKYFIFNFKIIINEPIKNGLDIYC